MTSQTAMAKHVYLVAESTDLALGLSVRYINQVFLGKSISSLMIISLATKQE